MNVPENTLHVQSLIMLKQEIIRNLQNYLCTVQTDVINIAKLSKGGKAL